MRLFIVRRIPVIALMIIFLSSCEMTLDDNEREVLYNNIAADLFNNQINDVGTELTEYLTDALSDYADAMYERNQEKIDNLEASKAIFGSWIDTSEIFGLSGSDIIAKQHNNYVIYINNHLSEMTDMAMDMVGILSKHPKFIESIHNEDNDVISMDLFSKFGNIPSSIPKSAMNFGLIELSQSDKGKWGELLMGPVNKPQLSIPAILHASILASENIHYPKPVYAVYDDDYECWVVGYDTEQAVKIQFAKKHDILHYEYVPTAYSDAYRKSEYNVLK